MMRLSDLLYAFRLWRRHPSLVAVAGLSLGLGVGATTTMYSVVNRVAHYELGFADADRLAVLSSTVIHSRPSASSRAAARRSPWPPRRRPAGWPRCRWT